MGVPYNKTSPGGVVYYKATRDGYVVTTGQVAQLCKVAPRTVAKWMDAGKLEHWRVPQSQDRRTYAHHVLKFLKDNNNPVPEGLLFLVRSGKDVVLYGCRSEIITRVMKEFHDRDGCLVHAPQDMWDLGGVMGGEMKGGTLVVGDMATVQETKFVLGKTDRDFWRTVHLPAHDQRPVEDPLFDHRYFMPEELPKFLEHLRFNLTHLVPAHDKEVSRDPAKSHNGSPATLTGK